MDKSVKRIDVIVPVYNEEGGIRDFYNRIRGVPLNLNLIFVDNASTDKTLDVLKSFKGATIIAHKMNEGYGASICTGIKNSSAEAIVIIDADCEYQPEIIPRLIERLQKSDVVYGSRFRGIEKPDMPYMRVLGNSIISVMFNILFRQKITDLYTGCKAFKRTALEGITLERKGFEHVLELGIKFAKKGILIDEIPVQYSPRRTGYSKMKHLPETIKFLYYILYYKLKK